MFWNFIFGTLIICSIVILPTSCVFGFALPFCILISRFISSEAGGLPIFISNSFVAESTTTITGTFMPANSLVFSFICFTISPIFTPNGARLGPRGGAGVAFPPSTRTFTSGIFNCPSFYYIFYLPLQLLSRVQHPFHYIIQALQLSPCRGCLAQCPFSAHLNGFLSHSFC